MGLLEALDRFNRAHPWSHNDAFTRFVLRHACGVKRKGGYSAMDVGCGTGNLIEHLSRMFPRVIGVEPDPGTAAIATAHFSGSASVRIEQRPFGQEEPDVHDLIVFVASLHHMPLSATLQEAKRSLRRHGRIVIVGIAREAPADTPLSLISLALNPLVGLVRHPCRATQPLSHMQAPTAAATQSFEGIQRVARNVLPGIRMRRQLFWRYTATWTSPS